MNQPGVADIGAAFNWTFKKLGQHPQIFLLALPVVLLSLVQFFVNRAIIDSVDDCNISDDFSSIDCGAGFFTTILIAIGVGIVFGILIYIVQIGIYRAALKMTRGEAPDLAHLTSTENVGPYILTSIVTGICIIAGTLACVIPGIIAAFFLAFAPMVSLDTGASIGDAFRTSMDIAKRNLVPMIVLVIVIVAASWLGSLLFGILWLITLPIQSLLVANVYRQGNGEAVAP
ncbi:MAG: hypothetical protein IT195_03910 [Microthrixaceae bacterium]|nr:hypothetical protein [Microthrixaceae bacterium]